MFEWSPSCESTSCLHGLCICHIVALPLQHSIMNSRMRACLWRWWKTVDKLMISPEIVQACGVRMYRSILCNIVTPYLCRVSWIHVFQNLVQAFLTYFMRISCWFSCYSLILFFPGFLCSRVLNMLVNAYHVAWSTMQQYNWKCKIPNSPYALE